MAWLFLLFAHEQLGAGVGEDSHYLTNSFQMGWFNHQLDSDKKLGGW